MNCKQSAARSAGARPQEPAQVDADAERIAIKLKWGAMAERAERAREQSCVHDGVGDSGVDERREISEGVVEMVRQIPCRMAGAEALLGVTRGSRQMNGCAVIQ